MNTALVYIVNSGRHIGRHGTIEFLDQNLHPGFVRMDFIGDGGGADVIRLSRLSTAEQPGDENLVRERYRTTLIGKGGGTRVAAKAADTLARELVHHGKPVLPSVGDLHAKINTRGMPAMDDA